DRVQVNGSLTPGATLNDTFTVNAGTGANAGRVDFQRTSTVAFGLNIGTTETLTVIGNAGTDSFTVRDLTGVADLTPLTPAARPAADRSSVTPAARAPINARGGTPPPPTGDALTLNLTGATGTALTITPGASGSSGSWNFSNRQPVTFSQLESVTPV